MLTTTHILHLHLLKSKISLDPSPRDGEGLYENLANSGISTHYTPEMLDRYQKLSYFDGVSFFGFGQVFWRCEQKSLRKHFGAKVRSDFLRKITDKKVLQTPSGTSFRKEPPRRRIPEDHVEKIHMGVS